MDKYVDLELLKALILLRGLTPHRLALNIGIEPSNFSRALAGRSGMLSLNSLVRVCNAIGFDLDRRSLAPGIHRFTLKSNDERKMDQSEEAIRSLLPDGTTGILIEKQERVGGFSGHHYVLFPHLQRNVRIVLSIKTLSPIGRGLRLSGLAPGSTWRGGDTTSDHCPPDSVLMLPSRVIDRVTCDKTLTIEALDQIVGLSPDDMDWTWKMVTAGLEAKGMTPRETAHKLGLLQG